MIHINLLPSDIRKEAQKKISASGSGIPLEVVVGSIGGVFFVLLFLHVVLMSLTVQRMASYKALEQQWKTLESRRGFIDGITQDLRGLKAEQGDIERLFSQTFRLWAPTLNRFTTNLPKGVWIGKMTVENDEFTLQGSAIARDMDEIVAVNSYENKMRADVFLQSRFKNFILDTVEKRTVHKVDVADFTIRSAINPVAEENQLIKDKEAANLQPSGTQANTQVTDQKTNAAPVQ